MSLTDLLPEVRALPHPDKLRLLQYLANELARDAGVPDFDPDATYPVWSPHDQFEAAAILLELLRAEGATT